MIGVYNILKYLSKAESKVKIGQHRTQKVIPGRYNVLQVQQDVANLIPHSLAMTK